MARRRFFRDAGPVQRTRINEMIRITPIRLIDHEGNQVGVVETPEALRMAREAGLDLVEISPDTRPPVCKIVDYGKHKYELSKRERKNSAASKSQEMKEVRLGRSIKVDPHDIKIRLDRARKFLMEGHKVLLVQRFRGREMMHKNLGAQILRQVVDQLDDISKVEVPPRVVGRGMSLILAPDKIKIEAIKRKEAKAKAAADAKPETGGDAPPPPPPTPTPVAEQAEEAAAKE